MHARDPAVGGAQLRERAVDWLVAAAGERAAARCRRATACRLWPQICGHCPHPPPRHRLPSCRRRGRAARRRGFSAADVAAALRDADGDKVAACPPPPRGRPRRSAGVGRRRRRGGRGGDAREEETALEAIMPTASPDPTRLARVPASLASLTPPGTLELWLPAEGGLPLRPRCRRLCARRSRPPRSPRSTAGLRAPPSSPRSAPPAAFALASWLEAELSSFVAEKHPPPPPLLRPRRHQPLRRRWWRTRWRRWARGAAGASAWSVQAWRRWPQRRPWWRSRSRRRRG